MTNVEAPGHGRPRCVYFFSTCVVDVMAPQAGLDAITLIQEAGIEVVFPAAQSCCGQPAYTSGYVDEARRVARAQLDLFVEPWPVVVPSGSCAGMMVHHWARLFEPTPLLAAKARALAARVVEWSHFACDVLGLAVAPAAARTAPVRVALHTSCSARREMGSADSSAALLAALPGVELVHQEREAECCGFGGTFAARHPAISGAMVADKLDSVARAGAEVIVSADCGCLLNLHHAAEHRRRRGERQPRCVHLASFLRERLGATDAAQQVTD